MGEQPKFAECLSAQRAYAEMSSRNPSSGLYVPEAFVRGIRNIGYKSNVEAIAELIDNSIQAYSERIDLVFDFAKGGSASKPTQLAIMDNGHGMDPGMLRLAMMWGGTHRENDRSGLGRFGYGLPCATVSIGRRFRIYSKVLDGKIHGVTLDLDLLDQGQYRNLEGEITVPPALPVDLPDFLCNAIASNYPNGWTSGTIVVIDKLDRLDWTTSTGLRRNLLRHFGVAYHKLLRATAIYIDGEPVRPIDPLFLSPEGELHSLDDDRANALESVVMKIQADAVFGHSGEVILRYAWLPPTFGATDKSRDATGINANARFPILKQYHGIVFSRNGRIVDVQSRTPWTTFINNDRYIRVEIEFSASLDEAFGVTTSKQQISVSNDMWDRLGAAGLSKAIEHLRGKVRLAKAERQKRHPSQALAKGPTGLRAPFSGTDATEPVESDTRQTNRSIKAGELGGIVSDMIDRLGASAALQLLVSNIVRRMSVADQRASFEYEQLLRDWAAASLLLTDAPSE